MVYYPYIADIAEGFIIMQLERKESQLSVRRNRYFGGLKCETAQADLREFKGKSAEEKLASSVPASVVNLQQKLKTPRPNRDWLKRQNTTQTLKNKAAVKQSDPLPTKRRALYTQTPCYSARRLLEEPSPH